MTAFPDSTVGKDTPSYSTTLWLNVLVGAFGIDRFYAGSVKGGTVKLILGILAYPIALIVNLVDYLSLLTDEKFAFSDKANIEVGPTALRHKVMTAIFVIVVFMIVGLGVLAMLNVLSSDQPTCPKGTTTKPTSGRLASASPFAARSSTPSKSTDDNADEEAAKNDDAPINA